MGLWRLSKFQTLGRKSKGENLSMSCHPCRSQHLPWAKHRRGTSVGPANSVLVHLHPFLKQGTHVNHMPYACLLNANRHGSWQTQTQQKRQVRIKKRISRAAFLGVRMNFLVSIGTSLHLSSFQFLWTVSHVPNKRNKESHWFSAKVPSALAARVFCWAMLCKGEREDCSGWRSINKPEGFGSIHLLEMMGMKLMNGDMQWL